MPIEIIGENTGDDYTGCDETYLQQFSPTVNHGASAVFYMSKYSAGNWNHTLIKFPGISSLPGSATISDATLYLYDQTNKAHTHTFKRLLQAWTEGGANWNTYDGTNSWPGSGGASTDGVDKSATSSGDIVTTSTPGYFSNTSAQLLTDVQNFYSGTWTNDGWHGERSVGQNDAIYTQFTSSEGANGQRPYLEVDYTVGGAPTGNLAPETGGE